MLQRGGRLSSSGGAVAGSAPSLTALLAGASLSTPLTSPITSPKVSASRLAQGRSSYGAAALQEAATASASSLHQRQGLPSSGGAMGSQLTSRAASESGDGAAPAQPMGAVGAISAALADVAAGVGVVHLALHHVGQEQLAAGWGVDTFSIVEPGERGGGGGGGWLAGWHELLGDHSLLLTR